MVHQDGAFPWPPSSCSFPRREGQGCGAWRQRQNLETKVHGGWGRLGGGRPCPILRILPLAFFASRGGEHWWTRRCGQAARDYRSPCLALNPGTSTHCLGNLDYSTSLCLSVPICIMDTIAYTCWGL